MADKWRSYELEPEPSRPLWVGQGKFGSTSIMEKIGDKILVGDGCWEWIGGTQGYRFQYGVVKHRNRKMLAHRIVYQLLRGPIPEGLVLDHLCRNPRCVNPGHLEPVTIGENVLRGEGPAARVARRTHCFRGHEKIPENMQVRPNGTRYCKVCANDSRRPRRRRS
jgi:hypothetical protein